MVVIWMSLELKAKKVLKCWKQILMGLSDGSLDGKNAERNLDDGGMDS